MGFIKSPHFSELFDAAPILDMGDFAPEIIYAQSMYSSEHHVMPAMDEALVVFQDIPAKLIYVPVDVLQQAVMATDIGETFSTFQDYHEWYLSAGDTPQYDDENRWPCIASGQEDEVIQDGNHRMHSYIKSGAREIPILNFDVDAWWKAHASWLAASHGVRSSPLNDLVLDDLAEVLDSEYENITPAGSSMGL
ncbi:hypothetical protein [Marinimicrobium sp. ABcell2]|uniref:hypothetical protein n=1 Tax=Marinimicrobium sp. ABcell2 TaxID=3069751 RepID=UPI0027B32951|nr:hypothetical protein [Marinimicrobium sp. ABcell2]MDQ2077567.1 hypothetical protein [Marinimicrobium sp. ABcell2]